MRAELRPVLVALGERVAEDTAPVAAGEVLERYRARDSAPGASRKWSEPEGGTR
jgi:hypothetical protein